MPKRKATARNKASTGPRKRGRPRKKPCRSDKGSKHSAFSQEEKDEILKALQDEDFSTVATRMKNKTGKQLKARTVRNWKSQLAKNQRVGAMGRPRVSPSPSKIRAAVDKHITVEGGVPTHRDIVGIITEESRKKIEATGRNPIGYTPSVRTIRRSKREASLKQINIRKRPNNRKDAEFDIRNAVAEAVVCGSCLLYTSPSPRDA